MKSSFLEVYSNFMPFASYAVYVALLLQPDSYPLIQLSSQHFFVVRKYNNPHFTNGEPWQERLSDLPEVMQAAHYGAGNSTRTPKQQTNAPAPGLSVLLLLHLKSATQISRDGSDVIKGSLVKTTEQLDHIKMGCLGVELHYQLAK